MFADLLIDTCIIQRNTPGVADAYGTGAETWPDYLTGQACRLVPGGGKEVMVGSVVVIADYRLFIASADVTEQDRVVLGGVTYEILLVQKKQDSSSTHHIEALLRTVR